MKPIAKQPNKKAAFTQLERKLHPLGGVKNTKRGLVSKPHPSFLTGFTIIELLTVMSIIIILIGLLVPGLNMARRYARGITQRNQFRSIGIGLEFFNSDFGDYPNSDALDQAAPPQSYCGAMKLCEAMMGQDLMGFHPRSIFRSNGEDGSGNDLYPSPPGTDNMRARRGLYVQLENANAYRIEDLYASYGNFDQKLFVLCDVYRKVANRGTEGSSRIGMPVLYYKANTLGIQHDPNDPEDDGNIYDYHDNDELVERGMPWDLTSSHDLETPGTFYEITGDGRIDIPPGRPHRADSYILMSAGFDGEYGTDDDIFNFED